jgi:CheY-like chemotaxis protein/HPt (histidine-containing phosphotransfer) domain-containing protein
VEDNLVNRKVVVAILRKRGYTIEVAGNGQEALEMLAAGAYALVLMDIQMPVMDGLEATRRIRQVEAWRNLPVLAMTAHAMIGDRERCLEGGMNAYISKPVNPAHLIATVESFLEAGAAAGETGELACPIDRGRAVRLMDSNQGLLEGLVRLFLQLAPERMERLHAAAARADATELSLESRALQGAAERIAAQSVAECAAAVDQAAQERDYARIGEQLVHLESELERLRKMAPDPLAAHAAG